MLFIYIDVDPQSHPFSQSYRKCTLTKDFILGLWEEVKTKNMWQDKIFC